MQFDFVNFRGERLPLIENEYCFLTNVEGQTVANVNISSVIIGSVDGDEITNMQAQPRPLIIYLRIKRGVDVEDAKRAVLRVVKLKRDSYIEWTQNNRKTVLNGVVEGVELVRWNNEAEIQITLHCSMPFWEDAEAVFRDINEALPLHYFTTYQNDMLIFPAEGVPFGEYDRSRTRNIYNAGDVSVGLMIEILAIDTVTNPIINGENGEFFGVGHGTGNKKVVMQTGDIIKINTTQGKKSVTLNGQSLLTKIKPSSTWLQLAAGDNVYSINSDDESIENMTFTLSYKQKYI